MDYDPSRMSPYAPYRQGQEAADPSFVGPQQPLDFSTAQNSQATLAGYQQKLATLQSSNPTDTSFQYDPLTPRTLPNGMANPAFDPMMTPANLRDSQAKMAAFNRGEAFTPDYTDAQRWQQASLKAAPLVAGQQQQLQAQLADLSSGLHKSHSNMEFNSKVQQMQEIQNKLAQGQGQLATLQQTQGSLANAGQQQLKQIQYYAGQNPTQFGDQATALTQGFSPEQIAIGKDGKSQVDKAQVAVDYLNQHGITDPAKREAFTKAVSGGLGFSDLYTTKQQMAQTVYEQQQADQKATIAPYAADLHNGHAHVDGNGTWWKTIVIPADPNMPMSKPTSVDVRASEGEAAIYNTLQQRQSMLVGKLEGQNTNSASPSSIGTPVNNNQTPLHTDLSFIKQKLDEYPAYIADATKKGVKPMTEEQFVATEAAKQKQVGYTPTENSWGAGLTGIISPSEIGTSLAQAPSLIHNFAREVYHGVDNALSNIDNASQPVGSQDYLSTTPIANPYRLSPEQTASARGFPALIEEASRTAVQPAINFFTRGIPDMHEEDYANIKKAMKAKQPTTPAKLATLQFR